MLALASCPYFWRGAGTQPPRQRHGGRNHTRRLGLLRTCNLAFVRFPRYYTGSTSLNIAVVPFCTVLVKVIHYSQVHYAQLISLIYPSWPQPFRSTIHSPLARPSMQPKLHRMTRYLDDQVSRHVSVIVCIPPSVLRLRVLDRLPST